MQFKYTCFNVHVLRDIEEWDALHIQRETTRLMFFLTLLISHYCLDGSHISVGFSVSPRVSVLEV